MCRPINQLKPPYPCCQLPNMGRPPPSKGGWPRSLPKINRPIWESEYVDREGKYTHVNLIRKNCEKIAHNVINLFPKDINQIPWENQQERSISNQVGDPRDKLYCYLLQARLPRKKINIMVKIKLTFSRFTIVHAFLTCRKTEEILLVKSRWL